VNEKLNPSDVNMNTVLSRIEKKGDLRAHFLDEKMAVKNSQILQMFPEHD
jgi:hypothetical protein